MKGQDIVVLAALMKDGAAELPFAELGKLVKLSASEAHASVKRLVNASLLDSKRGLIRSNVIEFLLHGLRYAFPIGHASRLVKGIPTAYAAPIAADEFAVTGLLPVWELPNGPVCGRAVEPLYSSAPIAAQQDAELYERLAVIDMFRGGRLRERQFAEEKLRGWLSDRD